MAIYQTQIERKVYEFLKESIQGLGCDIVKVKNFQSKKTKILQIIIERMDEKSVSIDDCERVSRHVSNLLDVEDIIDDRYNLEISSPGLDKPLTRRKDFESSLGMMAKISLFESINGRRRFSGKICEVAGDEVVVAIKDTKELLKLNLNNIEDAFLQYFNSDINSNTK